MEDPIAMSLASLVMSRPGSVMDDRPGSAMSVLSGISPTKTPVRSRKMRNATSMNSVDYNKGMHLITNLPIIIQSIKILP